MPFSLTFIILYMLIGCLFSECLILCDPGSRESALRFPRRFLAMTFLCVVFWPFVLVYVIFRRSPR